MSSFESLVLGKSTVFWKKAKQKDLTSLGKAITVLRNISTVGTHRNLMDFRYLGLVDRIQGDEYVPSTVGAALLETGVDGQPILDAQLEKLWLANPTNSKLSINIFPVRVLVELIKRLSYITFIEYQTFCVWIHRMSEIDVAVLAVLEYRQLSAKEQEFLVEAAARRSTVDDFGDMTKRLFRVLTCYSGFAKGNVGGVTTLSLSQEISDEQLAEFDEKCSAAFQSAEGYEGWQANQAPPVLISKSESGTLGLTSVVVGDPPSKPLPPARDYLEVARAMHAAGREAEEFVLENERAFLTSVGRSDLAAAVQQVSLVSDAYGYDIRSFDVEGAERHLEVKSIIVRGGVGRFFISQNEVSVAQKDAKWELVSVIKQGSAQPRVQRLHDCEAVLRSLSVSETFNHDRSVAVFSDTFVVKFIISDDPE